MRLIGRKWESLAEWGVEGDTAGTAYGTAVTPTEGMAWLRSATINADSHAVPVYNISGAKQRSWDNVYKERMETTLSLTFWMPSAFTSGSAEEIWLMKLPVDAYNASHSGSCYLIPTTTYGSMELLGTTWEIGHNKAGSIRMQKLAGCVVDRFTCRAREGAPVEFTMDMIAKTATFNNTSFGAGSNTRSTQKPLDWSNTACFYADDGSYTTVTDITEFEFTINNNLEPRYDLYGGGTTQEFNRILVGKKEITGSFTIDLSTTSGLAFYDALCNDATAAYTPTNVVDSKECGIKIGVPSSFASSVYFRFRNIFIPNVPMDIDPSAVQQVTIPWNAQYVTLRINTPDDNVITNWDVQA